MTDRSRTTSLKKQQILQKMQYNFQKIDPSFQIKYFIGDNSNLVEYQIRKWDRKSKQKTVLEQQIERAVKTLKHPFILESYAEKNLSTQLPTQPKSPIQQQRSSNVKSNIKTNEKIYEKAQSPIKDEIYSKINIQQQQSPLKKLFVRYSDLLKNQYDSSSEQMKQLFHQHLDSEQEQQEKSEILSSRNPKSPECSTRRPQTVQKKKKINAFYSIGTMNPLPKNREKILQKNTLNLIQLDELQSDLDSYRKSLFDLKRMSAQFKTKTQTQKKKSFFD